MPVGTSALSELLFTGGMAEIGGRSAHIVNVALKIRFFCDLLGFFQNGFVTSGLNDPALVEGQGAKCAGTETAAIADQAEFHFLYGRHTPQLCVAGMPSALIGKPVHIVHFLGG